MIDFKIVVDYVFKTQDIKKIKKYNTNFTCKTIYYADDKTDFSIFLISGDFTPFLFSNNKIYKVTPELLHDYYINHSHKLFLYEIQQENEKTKI